MESDARTHELLPWYVTGMLEEEEAVTFRRHLDACEACRSEKALLEQVVEQVKRHGAAFLEDHPPSETLVAYARGELGAEQAAGVRRHLELCATCPVEARWVSGEEVAPRRRSPLPLGWVAASLAAGIAAGFGLHLLLPGAGVQTASVVRPQLVGETQLSQAPDNVVHLRPGETRWTVYFPIDLPAEDFPCTVEIEDESGGTRFRATRVELGELVQGQYLFVECAGPPGKYTVRIAAAGGQPRRTLSFEVKTAER